MPEPHPSVRGKLLHNTELAPYTWFRVGGPADWLFLPADEQDLADYLRTRPASVPITALGVASNTLVRDGGLRGVTVKLAGRGWGDIQVRSDTLWVQAGALDLSVARHAAQAGLGGLSFLSGIPGTLGGAIRTNAGCYGRQISDVLVSVEGISHTGQSVKLSADAIRFDYRHSDFPEDIIITAMTLRGEVGGDPDQLKAEISEHQARRAETQPIRHRTGGSSFANPDPPGTQNARSAWKLIDAAGCRGLRVGGAQVSEQHCNFLINTGEASAADIEALGELVRSRVLATSGVELRWEIRRIGQLPDHTG